MSKPRQQVISKVRDHLHAHLGVMDNGSDGSDAPSRWMGEIESAGGNILMDLSRSLGVAEERRIVWLEPDDNPTEAEVIVYDLRDSDFAAEAILVGEYLPLANEVDPIGGGQYGLFCAHLYLPEDGETLRELRERVEAGLESRRLSSLWQQFITAVADTVHADLSEALQATPDVDRDRLLTALGA